MKNLITIAVVVVVALVAFNYFQTGEFKLLPGSSMSEEEQGKWLVLHHIIKYKQPRPNQILWESLADLAFRLRDEADRKCYWEAAREVWRHCYQGGIKISDLWTEWWIENSQPIHWIAAALEAKKESK